MDRIDSRSAPSPEPASDDVASPFNLQACDRQDLLGFEPVPLRYRSDGLTPDRQRAYVEALADCGIAREAAARVGVSEQAIARVRRRFEARDFDRACEAAHVFGARRLRSVAWERAIEGTLKGHYYHGERIGEERVFDNRLLTYLLGKVEPLLQPSRDVRAICDNWEPCMEALGQGRRAPDLAAAAEAEALGEAEIWRNDDGEWRTSFPPPADFDGYEEGEWDGDSWYCRALTGRELAAIEADVADERAQAAARRDRFFGFVGDGISSPGEAGTTETSETSEEEDGGEAPLEYKSMHPPAPSFRRKPEPMNTAAGSSVPLRSWIPDQVRDDERGTAALPYPRHRFRSIPRPARLWGEHG